MSNLRVHDDRMIKRYLIPIRDNAVRATDFAKITDGDVDSPQGLTILDPGYRNTAVLESNVTQLNDAEGTIIIRGHDLDDLMQAHDFEDVAHLLIWGRMPTLAEKVEFIFEVADVMNPPSHVYEVIKTFPMTAPAITIWTAALSAWNSTIPEAMPVSAGKLIYKRGQEAAINDGITRTLGMNAAAIALVSCHRRGVQSGRPEPRQSLAYNLLLMAGLVDTHTKQPKPEHVKLMSKLMVMYADHEMTNSTAAFLHVASTLADPISCFIAALQSAHGPLHAGAILMAYRQFDSIGEPRNVHQFLEKAKQEKTRLFGFGNRVWKTGDPRSKYMKEMLNDEAILPLLKGNRTLSVAMEVDRQTSEDDYFVRNRIRPNVDLLGCFVLNALGFDEDSSILLASVGRAAGMLSH